MELNKLQKKLCKPRNKPIIIKAESHVGDSWIEPVIALHKFIQNEIQA